MWRFDNATALVIAPHPDDEAFGCGGLIHHIKTAGGKVYVLFMTVGDTEDFSVRGATTASERVAEVERVARALGLDGYEFALSGDEYHLKLDAVPQTRLVTAIERGGAVSLQALRPDVVLIPPRSDYNQDHRACGHAAMTALRPASPRYRTAPPVVLTYELPYHQWNVAHSLPAPGMYVKLGRAGMEAKLAALTLYESQLKDPDNPLSLSGVRTLAAYRGLQCGASAAEAFQVDRWVV